MQSEQVRPSRLQAQPRQTPFVQRQQRTAEQTDPEREEKGADEKEDDPTEDEEKEQEEDVEVDIPMKMVGGGGKAG